MLLSRHRPQRAALSGLCSWRLRQICTRLDDPLAACLGREERRGEDASCVLPLRKSKICLCPPPPVIALTPLQQSHEQASGITTVSHTKKFQTHQPRGPWMFWGPRLASGAEVAEGITCHACHYAPPLPPRDQN